MQDLIKTSEIRQIVDLYLSNNDITTLDIAKKVNRSKFQVKGILKNKVLIENAYPEDNTIFNKVVLKDEALKNKVIDTVPNISGFLLNKEFYINMDKKSQINFLISLALNFRINLQYLSFMVSEDENKLYNALAVILADSPILTEAIYFVFHYDYSDQVKNTNLAMAYSDKLNTAYCEKNSVKYLLILNKLKDKEFNKIRTIKKENPIYHFNDSEIIVIINYQLKYSLDNKIMANLLGISHYAYRRTVVGFFKSHEELTELRDKVTYLADIHAHQFYNKRNNAI